MVSDQIAQLERCIGAMRLGKAGGRAKPHKPLMLLAVLDMFDAGLGTENRIFFDQDLVERFEEYFQAVSKQGDWCQPAPPFFHLRSSHFWRHQPISGRESQYAALRTSGGGSKRILDNIEYAYLSNDAFEIFSDPAYRRRLRGFILEAFFTREEQEALSAVIERQAGVSSYELLLRQHATIREQVLEIPVRDAAFRRVVLRNYDYQCAACGLRILLPGSTSPIDAAHLVPWSESRDDSPQNGIALCKIHHWALDACVLSPDLDLRWRVSRVLDRRRNSERELTRFEGLPLLLPRDSAFYPRRQAIEWRLERLLR